jgi:hypothetical protein
MKVMFNPVPGRAHVRRLSPADYETVANSMEVLETWAAESRHEKSIPGFFLTVSCNGKEIGVINLASASKQQWEVLVQLDSVLSRHFRHYGPIAEDAEGAIGWGVQ